MKLQETLSVLIKEARLNKSEDLKMYSYLKSLLIENSKAKKPIDEETVLRKYRKTVEKSMEHYVDKEPFQEELKIIDSLLPKLMSEDEVREIVTKRWVSDLELGSTIGHFQKFFKEAQLSVDSSTVVKVVREKFNA